MHFFFDFFRLFFIAVTAAVLVSAKNCTIDINMTVLEIPANCTRLFGHVYIESDAVHEELEPIFSSIEEIYGCVRIMDTRLESLSFLRKVRHISCVYGEDGPWLDRPTVALLLWGNIHLKSFGMDSLVTFNLSIPPDPYDAATFAASIRLDVTSKYFCWTLEEVRRVYRFPMLFMGWSPICSNPPQKGSSFTLPSKKGRKIVEKVCYTAWAISLDDLEYGCVILVGLYNITSAINVKEGVKKLATVRELYGPLTLTATNLTKVVFPNLKIVASGNYFNFYGIRFEANYLLQDISFPKLEVSIQNRIEVPWGAPAPYEAPIMFWNNPRINMSCSSSFPRFPAVRLENRNGNLNIECSGVSIPGKFLVTAPPEPDQTVQMKKSAMSNSASALLAVHSLLQISLR